MNTIVHTGKQSLATFVNVSAAAQRLADRGERQSIRNVMAELGGGSPNAILPLLSQWKSARPAVQTPELTINPAIGQLIAQQVATESAKAAQSTEQRAAEAEENAQATAEAGRQAERRVEELTTELATARDQVQQQAGQLAERAAEIEKVRVDAQAAIDTAEGKANREREAAESVRQDLVRAQIRIEQIPTLEKDLSTVRQQLRQVEGELATARQAEAVSTAKLESEAVRAADALAREKAAQEQVQLLRKELAEAQTKAQALTGELGQAKTSLAGAEARERAAQGDVTRLQLELADSHQKGGATKK